MSEPGTPGKSASDAASSILEEFGVETRDDPHSQLKLLLDLDDEEPEKEPGAIQSPVSSSAALNGGPAAADSAGSVSLRLFNKSAYAALLLVIGITAVLVIGGHLDLMDRSIFQQLTSGRLHQLEFTPPMRSRLVKNRFNRQPLIVMEGALQNHFSDNDQVGRIRLKALAFDKNNRLLESRITFAGIRFSEDELQSLSQSEIVRMQSISEGRDSPNLRLRRYQEIPYQAVFFNAGRDMDHAAIRIISYNRAGKVVYVRSPDASF